VHRVLLPLTIVQQFIEINAIGFRKILKKFDKRSTSTTKELYLSRQVDVQPVFNRQVGSKISFHRHLAYRLLLANLRVRRHRR